MAQFTREALAPPHLSKQPGRPRRPATRTAAAAAGLSVLVGALIMLSALVAMPGPWLQGYVSEAGTAEQPLAMAYRCGLVLLALGVGLLGVALRRFSPLVAGLLGGAAAMAATSGTVPCSDQCPLPPFEPTTVGDVVHATASIVGMVILTGAMVMVALSPHWRPAARRLAAGAAALTVPLGGALGLTMLFVGRNPAGAVLERVLLAVAISWVIGTALLGAPCRPPWEPTRGGPHLDHPARSGHVDALGHDRTAGRGSAGRSRRGVRGPDRRGFH